MFRRFWPKKKITWLLVAILIYALFIYDKDYGTLQDQNKDKISDLSVVGGTTTAKFLEAPGKAIIEKMQETKRGKAVVDAFIQSAMEDQYGSADLAVVAGKTANDILAFDKQKGEGDIAFCGSQLTVHTDSYLDNGIRFDTTNSDKPINFVVGEGKVIPGLEQGVIGMRQGGKRKLIIPPKFAYDNPHFSSNFIPKDKPIIVEVSLVEVKNSFSGITVFPQSTDIVKGIGNSVQCQQKVKISYKLGYQDNDKIIHSEERILHFTVGEGQVPIGLEIGVLGMQPGGIRGLVLPAKTQQTIAPPKTPLIPETKLLPREPMITMEVKLLTIE